MQNKKSNKDFVDKTKNKSDSKKDDKTKSSRIILKDYVNGNLLYCKLPPNYD